MNSLVIVIIGVIGLLTVGILYIIYTESKTSITEPSDFPIDDRYGFNSTEQNLIRNCVNGRYIEEYMFSFGVYSIQKESEECVVIRSHMEDIGITSKTQCRIPLQAMSKAIKDNFFDIPYDPENCINLLER